MGNPAEDIARFTGEIKRAYRVGLFHQRVTENRGDNEGPISGKYRALNNRIDYSLGTLDFWWAQKWRPLTQKHSGPPRNWPVANPVQLSNLKDGVGELRLRRLMAASNEIDDPDLLPASPEDFDLVGTRREKYFEVHDAVMDWHLKIAASAQGWLTAWGARSNRPAKQVLGVLRLLAWSPNFQVDEIGKIAKDISQEDGLGVDDFEIDALYVKPGQREFRGGLLTLNVGQVPPTGPAPSIVDFEVESVADEPNLGGGPA